MVVDKAKVEYPDSFLIALYACITHEWMVFGSSCSVIYHINSLFTHTHNYKK